MRNLLTAHQVAMVLALPSARCFHHRRRRLEAEHGFPEPVPGLGRCWDPAAIEVWLARHRGEAPTAAEGNAETLLVARARSLAAQTEGK